VLTTAELVPDVQILLAVTRDGEVRRNRLGTRRQKVRRAHTLARASTRDELLFLTESGTGFRLAAHQIPDGEAVQLSTLVSVPAGQPITTVLPIPEDKSQLVLVTARGVVKRVATDVLAAVLSTGTTVMRVADGDRLLWAGFSTGDQDVILVSATGQAIRFAEADVRSMGLSAAGVAGMRLTKGDAVVSADVIAPESQDLLVASSAGYGKRVRLSNFPRQRRGGKGVVAMKLTKTTGSLTAAIVVSKKERVVLISEKGSIADVAVQHVSVAGRNARGMVISGLRAKDTVCRLVNLG